MRRQSAEQKSLALLPSQEDGGSEEPQVGGGQGAGPLPTQAVRTLSPIAAYLEPSLGAHQGSRNPGQALLCSEGMALPGRSAPTLGLPHGLTAPNHQVIPQHLKTHQPHSGQINSAIAVLWRSVWKLSMTAKPLCIDTESSLRHIAKRGKASYNIIHTL